MTAITETNVTTQVYRVYIKAAPQAIWDAITMPEWTRRYGYGGNVEFDMRPEGAFRALTNEGMRAMGAGGRVHPPDLRDRRDQDCRRANH
jgi:uncharacterized protein YndB with AHSA1/START domain